MNGKGALLVMVALFSVMLSGCPKPIPGMTDDQLAANVRERLATSPHSSAIPVMVEARGGVVYLTGAVRTQRLADTAEQIARGAQGVTQVRNRLEILDPISEDRNQSM